MRILLAGAQGTVGQALQSAFHAEGHDVIAVSQRAPLADAPDVISIGEGADLARRRGVDLVVNAAGRGDLRAADRSGTDAAAGLARSARAGAVPSILVSTTRVLEGDPSNRNEMAEPTPVTPYGVANADNEAVWRDGGGGSILRLTNFFAPPASVDAPQAELLPWSLVTEGLRSGHIGVRSGPALSKEFIDAADAARACIALHDAGAPVGRFVTSPGLPLTLSELAEIASQSIRAVGREATVTFGPDSPSAPSWPPGFLSSLGWRTHLSVQTVAQVTADWVLRHAQSFTRA